MSPTMNAGWPWLLDVFGDRQSTRTIHFLCAFALVAFFIIHVVLVQVSGVFNNMPKLKALKRMFEQMYRARPARLPPISE